MTERPWYINEEEWQKRQEEEKAANSFILKAVVITVIVIVSMFTYAAITAPTKIDEYYKWQPSKNTPADSVVYYYSVYQDDDTGEITKNRSEYGYAKNEYFFKTGKYIHNHSIESKFKKVIDVSDNDSWSPLDLTLENYMNPLNPISPLSPNSILFD